MLELEYAVIVYSQEGKMTTLKKKATYEKFRKRKNNILKKGDELRLLCGADVYILLHRKGRYFTYKSTDQPSWPPPLEKIVRTLGTCFYITYRMLKHMQDQSYPLPVKKTPAEFDQGLKSEHQKKYHNASSLL
jgi:hypothetical protein